MVPFYHCKLITYHKIVIQGILKINQPNQISTFVTILMIAHRNPFRQITVKCFIVCYQFGRGNTLNLSDSFFLLIERNRRIYTTYRSTQTFHQYHLLIAFTLRCFSVRSDVWSVDVLIALLLE